MEKSARLAGYTLALLCLAALMTGIALLRDGSLFNRTLLKVTFSSVGTLMEDDPVTSRGVEVGRVAGIHSGPDGNPLVTLEFYKRVQLPEDSRFINFNHSLFGARMVVLVEGNSARPMDFKEVQAGTFVNGVTESIHLVDRLLQTMVEYQGLTTRLGTGTDSAPSFQQLLETRIYPVLDDFDSFAVRLQAMEQRASSDLERLALASGRVRAFSAAMAVGTDTLVTTANRTVARLAGLTAQSLIILNGLEKMMLAAQDTNGIPGRILAQRDLYERTLTMSHALHDLVRSVKEKGLRDIIGFWRNVHFRKRQP